MNSKGKGWKIDQLNSKFPLLFDGRTGSYYKSSAHDGRGFDVCFGDGSVAFMRTDRVIAARIASGLDAGYATYWAGVTRLPINPAQDGEVLAGYNNRLMQVVLIGESSSGGDRYAKLLKVFYLMREQ